MSVVLSGMLMSLSIHSAAATYFSFVVLIPLFVAVRVCRPWQGAVCGAIWGLTLLASSRTGFGQSIPLTPATVFALISLPAAYVGLGAALTGRIGFSPFVLAVGWMYLEAALSPTGALNHSEYVGQDWTAWFGSMIAPLLVGFCIALINAELLRLTTACVCQGTRVAPKTVLPEESHFDYQQLIRIAHCLRTPKARAPPIL